MDHEEGIRLRKRALKPIETKREKIYKLGAEEEEEICWCEKEINNEEEPLSPSASLFHEPNFNVHIIAIMGCVTRINPDVIKPRLVDTLLNHPRFSSFLVRNYKNSNILLCIYEFITLLLITGCGREKRWENEMG